MCLFRNILYAVLISVTSLVPGQAQAGGITLGGTRIIYPANLKQVSLSVRNTSDQSSFMVQSWVEKPDGNKSQDFVVTPPLYVSGPGNENTLRLMYVGAPLRSDQESLYYFNTKAIPSMDKKKMEGENLLMLAAVTRIKLFVRPAGLSPAADKAPAELSFNRVGQKLQINNPTPYYITLVQMKVGEQKLADTMVAPRGRVLLPLSSNINSTISFRTLNDFGAATPEQSISLK